MAMEALEDESDDAVDADDARILGKIIRRKKTKMTIQKTKMMMTRE